MTTSRATEHLSSRRSPISFAAIGRGPDVCIFGNLRIWAERGLIHIEDSRDDSYDSYSVRTTLHRLNAISDMLKNSRTWMARTGAMPTDEFDRHVKMLEKMVEVCRKA